MYFVHSHTHTHTHTHTFVQVFFEKLDKASETILFTAIISVIKSRRMRWVKQVAHMVQMKNTWKILIRNLKRRPRHTWDNIKMNYKEIVS
jgi:hypothetical protein